MLYQEKSGNPVSSPSTKIWFPSDLPLQPHRVDIPGRHAGAGAEPGEEIAVHVLELIDEVAGACQDTALAHQVVFGGPAFLKTGKMSLWVHFKKLIGESVLAVIYGQNF
jgi:hypothetical protein